MEKKLRTPLAAPLLIVVCLLQLSRVNNVLVGYSSHLLSSLAPILFVLILDLVLCITLFAKKRNNLLFALLGIATLWYLYVLIRWFSFFNLFVFASRALLFLFAFAFSEQTLIKADAEKMKNVMGKIFFLPAVLSAIVAGIQFSNALDYWFEDLEWFFWDFPASLLSIGTPPLGSFILYLLYAVILFSVAYWLKNPYAKVKAVKNAATVNKETEDGNYAVETYDEAYFELLKHILLCMFTCGIWYLIWIYRTTKYLNKAPNAEQYNPTAKLLLCMFIPFYQIYWFYKHGQRIDAFLKQKKLNNSDMTTLCLVLGILSPIIACILMQDRINTLCTTIVTAKPKEKTSTTDELKKYKELFDSGVITQEEFDAKKKQLLGL